MRISAYASEQYRRTDALAARANTVRRTTPQASVTTTSFGFRLGSFGLDYQSERTVLDPSLSGTAGETERAARDYAAEQQVGSLRARVGAEGADYRDIADTTASTTSAATPLHRRKSALAAYAQTSRSDTFPLPGSMLANVV